MKKLMFLSLLLLVTTPLFAQRRFDIFFDIEGVRRTGSNESFTPGTHFVPEFKTGGGLGAGVNWFFTDRLSVEAKVAGLASKLKFRIIGTDSVTNVDLGNAQLYPISALLQWHFAENGAFRPYMGAGPVHVILRNVNKTIPGTSAKGVRFKDPTGLAVNLGLEWSFGTRWSAYGDARYVPIESNARATFPGTAAAVTMHVRPLIISTGLTHHF